MRVNQVTSSARRAGCGVGVKIYLVTPKNPASFWTFQSILPVLDKDCTLPNLSMPTVAGLTPRKHRVTLCDENVEPIDYDVDADIVGLTGYMIHADRIRAIADEFRRRGHFVVIGGPYASLCPDDAAKHCDVVFVDEAERTWPEFLNDFEKGQFSNQYVAHEKPAMTESPMPRFDLLRTDRYQSLCVQFARGCPFTCEFCDIIVMYGRRPRTKSVPQIMAEIEECRRLGADHVLIVDDNFIGNKKAAKELLRELAAWGKANDYPLIFNTEVSLNVAQDEELLELLQAANFVSIFIGIESPRAESLKETRKLQNIREDMLSSVHKIQSYGMQVQAGMIVGFDSDDEEVFGEHLRFIQEARIPVSMTGMLNAFPKTPLQTRMREEGRLVEDSTGNQFVLTNFEPKNMSREQLARGYLKLLQQLYSYDLYRERAVNFLLACGPRVGATIRMRLEYVRTLLRVLATMFVTGGRERRRFSLRLIYQVVSRRPAMAREALYFALLHKAFHDYLETLAVTMEEDLAAQSQPQAARGTSQALELAQAMKSPGGSGFESA